MKFLKYTIIGLMCISNVLLYFNILIFFVLNMCFIGCLIFLEIYINKQLKKKSNKLIEKKDAEYNQSLKAIYDEHIFSITHELRSPLSVISSSVDTLYQEIRKIYKILNEDYRIEYKTNFKRIKLNIEHIRNQYEIIESFVSSISEHASYVNDNKGEKLINVHNYLISTILNSFSYSRNMKIFGNRINFADQSGSDFVNISLKVCPHDLSRMIINIMKNSADAAIECFKEKQKINPNYTPSIHIHGLKSKEYDNKLVLNKDFIRLNCDEYEACQFYILIEDNGSGIIKENMDKLFKYKYTTKEDSSDTDQKHYGLGLYLTMKLAEKNNIKLFIKTNSEGTIFVLGFPKVYIGETECIKDDTDLPFLDNDIVPQYFSKDCDNIYSKYVQKEFKSDQYKKIKPPLL